MTLALLLALSLARGADAPAKAVVGQETVLLMDALPEGTSDFAVVKAEQKDGKWAVTVLPLMPGRVEFHGVPLEVAEPRLPDDADIEDITPPMRAWPALWPWALLALLAAAAWHGRREWLKRQGKAAEAPAEPPVPLEVRIEGRLAELEGSGLWERGEHAAYYLRLTEILRAYLEERWGVPATAMTTTEVARLVKAHVPLELSAQARALLEGADLVKFARVRPGPQDGPRDLDKTRRFVAATTPRPAPAAQEASA